MQSNFFRRFLYLLLLLGVSHTATAQPVVRKLFDHTRAIRLVGHHAFVVSESGLFIYDVTDTTKPALVSTLFINNNSSFDLEVSPPYAFILSGEIPFEKSTITAVQISNRTRPTILGQYEDLQPARAKDSILRGTTLIVSNANNLDFIDVSNPKNMKKVGSLQVTGAGGTVHSFARDGAILYAIYKQSNRSGIVAVDIENPRDAKIVSQINYNGDDAAGRAKFPISITVSKHVLYMSRADQNVSIYDAANPADLKETGTISARSTGVASEGDFLFIQPAKDRLASFDIRTPLTPRLVRELVWSGTVLGMQFDPVLLTAFAQWHEFGRSGLGILRFRSDGTFALQSTRTDIFATDVEELDGVTFIAGSNKLSSNRVTARNLVQELDNIAFFETLGSMEVFNNKLYVSTVDSEAKPGIRAINISDPAFLQERGYLQLDPKEIPAGETQPRFDVEKNVLVVALQKAGLAIYDVTEGAFTHRATFKPQSPEESLNATIRNGVAFLCTSRSSGSKKEFNLYVIDVKNPAQPQLISKVTNFDSGNFIKDLKAEDGFLYIAGNGKGVGKGFGRLYIFSIADLAKPVLRSKTLTGSDPQRKSGYAEEIKIRGNEVYVADGADGITVFDVSDRSHPQLIGVIDTPSNARGVSIDTRQQIHVADPSGYLIFLK